MDSHHSSGDRRVCILWNFQRKTFVCINSATGERVWEFKTGAWVFSSAAVAGNTVYFGCLNGRLYAIDRASGKKLWEYRTEGNKKTGDEYFDEQGVTKREAFGNFDQENGYGWIVEEVRKILSAGAVLSSPAVDNGVIFFGSTDGYLYALK